MKRLQPIISQAEEPLIKAISQSQLPSPVLIVNSGLHYSSPPAHLDFSHSLIAGGKSTTFLLTNATCQDFRSLQLF